MASSSPRASRASWWSRHPRVVRVVALSGGYSQAEANEKLAQNHGLIASFSRALAEGLTAQQSDEDFDATLAASVEAIYRASVTWNDRTPRAARDGRF